MIEDPNRIRVFELGDQEFWTFLHSHKYEKNIQLLNLEAAYLHIKDEKSYDEQAHCKATHARIEHQYLDRKYECLTKLTQTRSIANPNCSLGYKFGDLGMQNLPAMARPRD